MIDESSYDHTDVHLIDSEFQEFCKQLIKERENELAKIADLDRQVFSVQKSFDYKEDAEKGTIHGLSWQMSGTQTLEEGSQTPLYWPDVANYTVKDFEYFEKRYNECNNLFANTEYGLMAYISQRTPSPRHNDFKRQLCSELFELTKYYLSKAKEEPSDSHNITHFFISLRLAVGIVEKSKWYDRLYKIMSNPLAKHNEYFSSIDVSVISNVKDFLNQIDEALLEYLDEEDILPTPYGTVTLHFEKNNEVISIEMGETKIGFFTDIKNKKNMKLDGVDFGHGIIPPQLEKAFSCFK